MGRGGSCDCQLIELVIWFEERIYKPVDVFGLLVDFAISKIRKTLEVAL